MNIASGEWLKRYGIKYAQGVQTKKTQNQPEMSNKSISDQQCLSKNCDEVQSI